MQDDNYAVFTPAIEPMCEKVGQWIENLVQGGVIHGPSRFGKSKAVEKHLRSEMEVRFGKNIPLIIWSHSDVASTASIGAFHSKILDAAKHKFSFSGGRAARIERALIERLVAIAQVGGGRFVALVIDEAQGMSEREWVWLVQLHARLEQEGVLLCVISVASFQMGEQPYHLAMTGSAHAAARFMLHDYRFHGMQSLEHIRYVLAGFDTHSSWPEGSGISYTQGMAPKAWEEGLRLEDSAEHLWSALEDLLPEGYAGEAEYPMQSIGKAARFILMQAGKGADWRQLVSEEGWNFAVAQTGHTRLMTLVSAFTAAQSRKRSSANGR